MLSEHELTCYLTEIIHCIKSYLMDDECNVIQLKWVTNMRYHLMDDKCDVIQLKNIDQIYYYQ